MSSNDDVLRAKVKELIVQCARLKISPAELKDDWLLFDREKGGWGSIPIDVWRSSSTSRRLRGADSRPRDRREGPPVGQHHRRLSQGVGRQDVNNGALWDHSRHWLNIRPIYAFGEWVLDSMPLFVGYGITWGVTEMGVPIQPDQRGRASRPTSGRC
jgi:hypothetical protein